jgi:hypothetical protein
MTTQCDVLHELKFARAAVERVHRMSISTASPQFHRSRRALRLAHERQDRPLFAKNPEAA